MVLSTTGSVTALSLSLRSLPSCSAHRVGLSAVGYTDPAGRPRVAVIGGDMLHPDAILTDVELYSPPSQEFLKVRRCMFGVAGGEKRLMLLLLACVCMQVRFDEIAEGTSWHAGVAWGHSKALIHGGLTLAPNELRVFDTASKFSTVMSFQQHNPSVPMAQLRFHSATLSSDEVGTKRVSMFECRDCLC